MEDQERKIICRRTGKGKGCTMTWAVGDKVTVSIPWAGDVAGVVRYTKMEGTGQKVQLRTAVYAPLMAKFIASEDKRWFDGWSLKPRSTVIPELGEENEH